MCHYCGNTRSSPDYRFVDVALLFNSTFSIKVEIIGSTHLSIPDLTFRVLVLHIIYIKDDDDDDDVGVADCQGGHSNSPRWTTA